MNFRGIIPPGSVGKVEKVWADGDPLRSKLVENGARVQMEWVCILLGR